MKYMLINAVCIWIATFFVANNFVYAQVATARLETQSPVVMPTIVMDAGTPATGPGVRMEKTGKILTFTGAALMVGGVALISTADDVYYSQTNTPYGTYEEGDPAGAIGLVMLVSGTGMTATGIVLWRKGARKYRRHLELQNNAKVFVACRNRGLALTFRF